MQWFRLIGWMGWSFVSVGGGGREGRRTASQAPAHVTPERASEPDDKHFSSIHDDPRFNFFWANASDLAKFLCVHCSSTQIYAQIWPQQKPPHGAFALDIDRGFNGLPTTSTQRQIFGGRGRPSLDPSIHQSK